MSQALNYKINPSYGLHAAHLTVAKHRKI